MTLPNQLDTFRSSTAIRPALPGLEVLGISKITWLLVLLVVVVVSASLHFS